MGTDHSEALDDREIATLAVNLRGLSHSTGFERRNAMGRVIFEGIFAGRREALERAAPQRQLSFRKLASLLRGSISKSELHRAVHVYLVCRELTFVPTSGHLTVSHVDVVLGLPLAIQTYLLSSAHTQRLTVRQLRQLRRALAECRVPGAAARIKALARRAAQSGRLTSEALVHLIQNVGGDLPSLPLDELDELVATVDVLAATCAVLRQAIGVEAGSAAPHALLDPAGGA